MPTGAAGRYRLAQIDDYAQRARKNFPWMPPVSLSLQARASAHTIPGTWGFGFWNDPFSLSLGFYGGVRRLPALPNAAWFFFASPPNHLSLEEHLPGHGNLAATFRSPQFPPPVLASFTLALPFLALPPTSHLLRKVARKIVRQSSINFEVEPTTWHEYRLDWEYKQALFLVDGQLVLRSELPPLAPLGLVIWVDNQYFAWSPGDRPRYGTLENQAPVWVEVADVQVQSR